MPASAETEADTISNANANASLETDTVRTADSITVHGRFGSLAAASRISR